MLCCSRQKWKTRKAKTGASALRSSLSVTVKQLMCMLWLLGGLCPQQRQRERGAYRQINTPANRHPKGTNEHRLIDRPTDSQADQLLDGAWPIQLALYKCNTSAISISADTDGVMLQRQVFIFKCLKRIYTALHASPNAGT